MSLVRVEVRNVYGLGKTELHRDVDREDPKAVLDGVAVSGLVGILRQLGDLTEFATEIFHGIQEEVVLTASRSNKLKMRLKQIEDTVPSIQKAVLAQTNHIEFAYTGGLEWHPRIPNVQDYFVYDDLPQFIMVPYDDCRDPPRLHLLDKFDINGPGSCLKRYTDPTHFKRSSRASKLPVNKKKKSLPRSRDVSRVVSMANQSDRKMLTSLSFSGRTSSSKTASTVEIESKSDWQDHRSCSFDSRSGGEKLKGVFTPSRFTPGPRTIASVLSETESEDANDDSPSQDLTARGSSCVSWHEKAEIVEADTLKLETDEAPEVMETNAEPESGLKEHREVETVQDITPRGVEMDSEDETESEEDDFVDALYTIDSESDNDQEVQKKISNEITEEEFDNYVCEQDTENVSNSFGLEDEAMCAAASDLHLSSPASKPDEMIHQDPWEALDISNGTTHSYSNGFSNPLYDTNGVQEHQESEDESSCDNGEGTKLWTNGNLLGLKPSKPEIVEETIQETDAEALQKQPLREAHKADFDWFTSSPQLDHMKISFTPSETLPSSELKLKLPDEYTFTSFQLVPETGGGTSLPDSDSDKDTFCRSSSYVSDNSDIHSVSISEQQSEVESGERNSQQELYDSFHRAPSLSAPSSQFETSNGYLAGKISYLQNPADPLPPPLPPLQWMVSKVPSESFEDKNKKSFKDTLTRALEQQRSSLSTVKKEESNNVIAYDLKPENNKLSFKETLTRALEQRSYLSTVKKEEPNNIITYDPKPDNNKQSFKDTLTRALEQRSSLSTVKKEESNSVIGYDTKPENNVRDYKQGHVNAKETQAGDFLHQIRTKQFTLRRVVTTKASSSEATMSANFSVILEKASSIRQAVASDDGDGESDSWSDSDM
ncbi:PREDICTED: protein SCAR1 [Brassica oleracea var. oleracea]|uniref:protein SCAR1 n=1 Tax=Brassica oleracea var. oleracea TaxID=109376 RepID=UPI0006A73FAC|nr:PREDICTED: protein SCAR1 [Brassica oleracea var. oleracea]